MSEERPWIFICQGPPRCDYDGAGDAAKRQDDCLWCEVQQVEEDGTVTIIRKPTQA